MATTNIPKDIYIHSMANSTVGKKYSSVLVLHSVVNKAIPVISKRFYKN